MKSCYFCGKLAEQYVGIGGAIASVSIIIGIIPVEILRAKLKKRHRELTELTDLDSGRPDTSSSMMRYLQDNQRYSQQDLSSLTTVPFNQNTDYNQSQQQYKYNSQQQQFNPSNLNQHISPAQYQQMGHASQQNYLMQQHLLQQNRNQQHQQQQQQQNFNYQPTHPAYYH